MSQGTLLMLIVQVLEAMQLVPDCDVRVAPDASFLVASISHFVFEVRVAEFINEAHHRSFHRLSFH
jgi:hypothetical protein